MKVIHGDCMDVLPTLDAGSVDSIVTDPPYALGFMGKAWDSPENIAHRPNVWREALRVLKPGGHLLAFGGTRTHHRLMCAIEDAGFEIRDTLGWLYGSGFPKSLDVSKAIDKAAGVDREVIGLSARHGGGIVGAGTSYELPPTPHTLTAPATAAARQWQGWGTALKPAWEPIILARKPLIGTVAANVLQHNTGGLNIDECRIAHESEADRASATPQGKATAKSGALAGKAQHDGGRDEFERPDTSLGRWPANILHDGSDEVLAVFPQSKGQAGEVRGHEPSYTGQNGIYRPMARVAAAPKRGDNGSAARFFYCPKASQNDRNAGLDGFPLIRRSDGRNTEAPRTESAHECKANHHPTVKPTELMRYLCRLITPPGGVILDPFMGSGSTGRAAAIEGFYFIGIELDPAYVEIAIARIDAIAEVEAAA